MQKAELTNFSPNRRQRQLLEKMDLIIKTNSKTPVIHVTPRQFEHLKIIAKGADELTFRGRLVAIYDENRI